MANLLSSGFRGAVYPVNPNYTEMRDKPCYPSLNELPEVPDCVVVALPATGVLRVIEEAAAAGVPSGIVVAEGFADGDTAEGRRRQRELQRLAATNGMAITGPCCMGVASLQYGFANSYFSIPEDAVPGRRLPRLPERRFDQCRHRARWQPQRWFQLHRFERQ